MKLNQGYLLQFGTGYKLVREGFPLGLTNRVGVIDDAISIEMKDNGIYNSGV
jgi:hypothetical protein